MNVTERFYTRTKDVDTFQQVAYFTSKEYCDFETTPGAYELTDINTTTTHQVLLKTTREKLHW